MFDVPPRDESTLSWKADVPIEDKPWSVGLIHGPSGAGKSTVARALFGDRVDFPLEWGGDAVVDDFSKTLSMDEIASVCQAVGFNTIPAWLRPFAVLSNGEKFRVDLARRLVESDGLVVVDEFTSVVDRRVAQIGAYAVQKYVRRAGRQFVGVTCHADVVDWLQPDWTFDPSTGAFDWRSVQPRPAINVEIRRVSKREWARFAPFHYLTASLPGGARCFELLVDGNPASFIASRPRPSTGVKGRIEIEAACRSVTLPDFQGLGLAFVLIETVAAAYKARGLRFRMYPAHPSYIRSFDRSKRWRMTSRPGRVRQRGKSGKIQGAPRPCATFEFAGGPDHAAADALL